jgi:endoglucanase
MSFNSDGLKKITDIFGPSGCEERVTQYIIDEIKDYVDEIEVDKMGSLIARKKGDGSKVMVAGHMDQIGLMVTDIDDNGFVRVTNIGGINPFVTYGERVIFRDGTIGVASCDGAIDLKDMKLDKIFVDIGCKNREEAEKVTYIGDTCVYLSQYNETEHTVNTGALDDRIGCFVIIEAIKQLKDVKNDCYFVFTVQEEVGIRGAKTSAFKIDPDLGIAVDITGAGDTPGAKRFAVKLHSGVAIKVRDNSLLSHPKLNKVVVDTCKEEKIDYQMEVLEFGGTDAGGISLNREGVPATCLSIPTRYAHSAHETVSKYDITQAINLVVKLMEKPLEL